MVSSEKEFQIAIDNMLNRNSLVLFNLEGEPIKFSYQRHICSKLEEVPGANKYQKIINSLIMAVSLWVSWEIHIKNSKYPFAWYGCVQFENLWLASGKSTPPYVVFNSEYPVKIKNFSPFKEIDIDQLPIDINTIDLITPKRINIKKAHFEDNDIVWRLCYS